MSFADWRKVLAINLDGTLTSSLPSFFLTSALSCAVSSLPGTTW